MDTKLDLQDTIYTIKTYGFQIFTYTFLAILLYNTGSLCGTEYHGIYVYGDCNQLTSAKNDLAILENMGINTNVGSPDGMIQYIRPTGSTDKTPIDIPATTTTTTTINPGFSPCPIPKKCICAITECETCINKPCVYTCPTCTVTACPENDYEELNTEVKTWRPVGAPSVQHGWFQMRDRLLEYTGGKRSKYREGPSISYKTVVTREEKTLFHIRKDNDTECMTFNQYPDLNDRKRWNWNKQECQTSNITICHL